MRSQLKAIANRASTEQQNATAALRSPPSLFSRWESRNRRPSEEATTSSLQALQAYSIGWQRNALAGADAGLPFFKRAVEIDPKFAMGYAALGLYYGTTGESDLAVENTRKAYELRDRVSDKERFFEGDIMPLNGGQRFADARSKLAGHLT
jgi:tetratricopeptide (TPR) repeat protein